MNSPMLPLPGARPETPRERVTATGDESGTLWMSLRLESSTSATRLTRGRRALCLVLRSKI